MARATFDASDYQGTGPENYERYFVPSIGAPLAADLVEAAALKHGERVLDVACGTGVVARLASKGVGSTGTVAGLDINPGMLTVARAAAPDDAAIDWYETSIEATPLSDASFDVVLCQMGLQFVADKKRALEEMRRLLAAGGRLVLNLPGPTPAPFAELQSALAEHIAPECGGFVGAVFSLHDPDQLTPLVKSAGFTEVDVQKSGKRLALPPPEAFLWQYVHSTPLAGMVATAGAERQQSLQQDVVERWKKFVQDESLVLELDVTTVRAR